MKIDDFSKYKRLAESQDFDPALASSEMIKVHQWMEESGRLDEGFLTSIWQWLKRNFSITARRLHSLADEYEKELAAEIRAEWKKTKDPKDLASKFRAGTFNRLSGDIDERMNIIAEDDETYRNLVRTLINKKNLKVKKEILKELSGMMDTEEFNDAFGALQKDIGKQYSTAEKEYDKANQELMLSEKKKIDEIVKHMRKKLNDEKSAFREIGISSDAEQMEFIKLMYMYVNALSTKVKSVEFDSKTVLSNAREYLDFVKEMSKKLQNSGMTAEEAVKKVRETMDKHLREIKNVQPLSLIKNHVSKDVSNTSSKEKSVEDEVTTNQTSDVLNSEEVETAIDTAAEETGKEDPANSEIVKEITKEVDSLFIDDNVEGYLISLNKRIDNFNEMSEDARKEMAQDYEYDLNDKGMLATATHKDVKKLIPLFREIVGDIVPYFLKTEESVKTATITVKRYLFEIYAIKKDEDTDGNLKMKKSEKTKLIKVMRAKYPELFEDGK